jgi:hypothetical protein
MKNIKKINVFTLTSNLTLFSSKTVIAIVHNAIDVQNVHLYELFVDQTKCLLFYFEKWSNSEISHVWKSCSSDFFHHRTTIIHPFVILRNSDFSWVWAFPVLYSHLWRSSNKYIDIIGVNTYFFTNFYSWFFEYLYLSP